MGEEPEKLHLDYNTRLKSKRQIIQQERFNQIQQLHIRKKIMAPLACLQGPRGVAACAEPPPTAGASAAAAGLARVLRCSRRWRGRARALCRRWLAEPAGSAGAAATAAAAWPSPRAPLVARPRAPPGRARARC